MQPAEGKIASENDYYDTAFVIGPEGKILFTQAKCVPIQVMHDGLPATQQRVWDSPWGKIGICICYDLSYRRVTDALIRQEAQLLIVPSMDAAGWGKQEHELHALVAPVRAAEYQVPIFRVCTSGISQYVAAGGAVEASAPFPGQGAVLASEVLFAGTRFSPPASIPVDQYLAPAAAIADAAAAAFVLVARMFRRIQRRLTLRGNARPLRRHREGLAIPRKATPPAMLRVPDSDSRGFSERFLGLEHHPREIHIPYADACQFQIPQRGPAKRAPRKIAIAQRAIIKKTLLHQARLARGDQPHCPAPPNPA